MPRSQRRSLGGAAFCVAWWARPCTGRTGRITLPTASPERDYLMQVRRGEIPLRSVLDRLHERSSLLEDTILSSDLPDEPDRDTVDRFLVDAYQHA
jgi:hypothetical protein